MEEVVGVQGLAAEEDIPEEGIDLEAAGHKLAVQGEIGHMAGKAQEMILSWPRVEEAAAAAAVAQVQGEALEMIFSQSPPSPTAARAQSNELHLVLAVFEFLSCASPPR
jgi:hypothetical protein